MSNKTAIVTGGTSGIGLSIVKSLVKANFDIYFIGTNIEKGLKIQNDIQSLNNSIRVEFIPLDLGCLKSIRSFIVEFKKTHTKLDLLANIAGILRPEKEETIDGIEKNFSISYLSAHYLSTEFIDLLKSGVNPRIINVSAKPSLMFKSRLDFNNLNLVENYNGFKASTLAVHAKTVFTKTLARKIKDNTITVNSFHPGNIKTDLFRNMPKFFQLIMTLVYPLFDEVSKTALEVTHSETYNNTSGKLIAGAKVYDIEIDKEYEEKLWKESEVIINRVLNN